LVAVRDAFAKDRGVRAMEPYRLVVRLIDEHIEVRPAPAGTSAGGGGASPEVVVELKTPTSPGSSLQSPYDPDAGCGYKGTGYELQVVESCNNEGTELILDFEVHPSGPPDFGKAADALDRLDERGLVPQTIYVDPGYVSGAALADAEKRGIDLHGPVSRGRLPAETVGRDRWVRHPDTGLLSHCPAGHPVTRHAPRTNPTGEVTPHAYVDGEKCRRCPLIDTCLARPPNNGKPGSFHIEDGPAIHLRDQRLTEQQDLEWKQRYRLRSGIEATNSELKRAHGLGRLRVRRLPRVRLAVAAKVMACNVKRWLRSVEGP
jgi:hypothetical protein